MVELLYVSAAMTAAIVLLLATMAGLFKVGSYAADKLNGATAKTWWDYVIGLSIFTALLFLIVLLSAVIETKCNTHSGGPSHIAVKAEAD